MRCPKTARSKPSPPPAHPVSYWACNGTRSGNGRKTLPVLPSSRRSATPAGRFNKVSERRHRMDLQLAGKTALITGGSKGIGRATAEVLAGEGCNLILVARELSNLDAAADAIRAKCQV